MNKNNLIEIVKSDGNRISATSFPGIFFRFHGENNHIILHEGTKFTDCIMILMSNSIIEIGQSKFGISNLKIWGNQSNIGIGKDFLCWRTEIRCHEKNTLVQIGNDCMFSEEITIYPTDVHAIYEQSTGKLLNLGGEVIIGDHVWCGRKVSILKGSVVRNNSVIAINSLLNKPFEESNIIIGGLPAKVLKHNINWSRESPWDYQQRNKIG